MTDTDRGSEAVVAPEPNLTPVEPEQLPEIMKLAADGLDDENN